MAEYKLDQRQIESAKEIVIPIRPKELYEGYAKIVHDTPIRWYQGLAKWVDGISTSKFARNSILAAVTLPLGVIGRNSARAAHGLSGGKWKRPTQVIGGVLGTGAAWWFAGKAAFGYLTTQAPLVAGVASQAGLLGGAVKIGALVTSAVVTGLAVAPPAFMLGTIVAASVGAAAIGIASTIPAFLNLKTGIKRTYYRIRGVKDVNFDGPEEEKAISYDSLRAREERKEFADMSWRIRSLTDEHQKEIYDGLKEKFEAAAAANQNQPAPVATPAAAPSAPKATP